MYHMKKDKVIALKVTVLLVFPTLIKTNTLKFFEKIQFVNKGT